MSHQQARHRKSSGRQRQAARHRRRSPVSSALRRAPALTVIVVGTTLVASAGAAYAVTSWPAQAPAGSAGHGTPAARGRSPAPSVRTGHPAETVSQASVPAATRAAATRRPASLRRPAPSANTQQPPPPPPPPPPPYINPLRDVTGLVPERVDMGADFGGSGPVYALGPAVITNAIGDSTGWPGGGWITYRLTSGPAEGLQVYLAEDVRPTVQVGQHVTSSTVIADMSNFGDGIETGWAMPDGTSAESQLAVAGGISGGGPFPADVGLNFDSLLVTLGVPAAPNFGAAGYGTLPAVYPASWASLRR